MTNQHWTRLLEDRPGTSAIQEMAHRSEFLGREMDRLFRAQQELEGKIRKEVNKHYSTTEAFKALNASRKDRDSATRQAVQGM